MIYKLILQQEAVLEMQDAYEWYENKRIGLGDELIFEAEICFEKICKNPQYYTSVNSQFRRIRLFRFPFLIIYEIENDTIIVNSFFHGKRNPKF